MHSGLDFDFELNVI